jgi:hypothetical protein
VLFLINEIELFRLRDIAFEYLPAAREKQHTQKTIGHEGYYLALFCTVTALVNRNLSAVELAAVRLLQAIALHATYDANDAEQLADETLYDSTISSIKNAVKTLSELTGKTISLDCNEPVADVGVVSHAGTEAKPREGHYKERDEFAIKLVKDRPELLDMRPKEIKEQLLELNNSLFTAGYADWWREQPIFPKGCAGRIPK